MYKKTVAFICEIDNVFHFDTLYNSALGGSETWILNIALQFAENNYHVIIFNRNDFSIYYQNNIEIVPLSDLERISSYIKFDHIFINRFFNPYILKVLKENNNCDNIYFILHDIRLWKYKNDNGPFYIDIPSNYLQYEDLLKEPWYLNNIKKIFFMSDWHKEFNKDCNLPDNLIEIIGNGINMPILDSSIERDNNIFWSSCLERGFDDIMINKIMPQVHQKLPDVKLYVASYNKLPVEKYDSLGYVFSLGSLSKDQLYNEMQKHKISFLPLVHWETFCITAIENVANDMELVCPYKYGLQTTFRYFKDLFIYDGDYDNPKYCEYVANTIVDKIKNYNSQENILKRNILNNYIRENYSWQSIFKKLYNIINIYEKGNSDN